MDIALFSDKRLIFISLHIAVNECHNALIPNGCLLVIGTTGLVMMLANPHPFHVHRDHLR